MASILVTTYGADPTGTNDSLSAINQARAAALASDATLVFPSGEYKISGTLELGFPRLHVLGEERVVIRAAFNGGNIVSFDAGSAYAYQHSFKNFIIQGNGSSGQTGLYKRHLTHGHVADVRVRNVTKYAFHICGDVFSVYDRLVSDRQDEGDDHFPTHDLFIDEAEQGATTACTFNDCILEEGTQYGLYLAHADNCIFNGGGAEGLPGWGVYVSSNSTRNHFSQFYCEQNSGGDFDIHGNRNVFVNCEAYDGNQTTIQFKVEDGANGTVIEQCGTFSGSGAAVTKIMICDGATDTVVRDCALYSLIDNGTRTWLENCHIIDGDPQTPDTLGGSTSFSPSFSGSTIPGSFTYDVRTGTATRIGRRVFFEIGLRISGVTNGATGNETWIGDLPWPAAQGAAAVVDDAAMIYPTNATVLGALISGTKISLRGNKNSGYVNSATLTAGSFVRITGHYEVA
jgi:hypothetical protein